MVIEVIFHGRFPFGSCSTLGVPMNPGTLPMDPTKNVGKNVGGGVGDWYTIYHQLPIVFKGACYKQTPSFFINQPLGI